MNVNSITTGAPVVDPGATRALDNTPNDFQNLIANNQNSNSDIISVLLEVITLLMNLLKGDQKDPNAESTAGDDLTKSLSDLSEAITALTGSEAGTGTGTGAETAPVNPQDLNGDGTVTVFEVVDHHIGVMAEIQSMAKTPLDYVAGGRSYK